MEKNHMTSTITILFNQESIALPEKTMLSDILKSKGYNEAFAVSLNRKFIPKVQHPEIQLCDHDHLEIIQPMQGG